VFYFLEAMIEAGERMGLSRTQAQQLATQTFVGASALAQTANEPPEVLRAQVTSPGGTTHVAISAMQAGGAGSIKAQFMRALQAAQQRAVELGQML
jgi:pyrroline-5-carboxylate reductase